MTRRRKTGATMLALAMAALPLAANAACLNRTDMHAMQAASLQQRLMVAAFTCHDTAAYNRFVLSHRGELQQSDATLLAYFKKNGGEAGYHTYKTHLANASALDSSRSDGFCGDVGTLFRMTSGGGSLDDMLDRMPTASTGYSACYVADTQPVQGGSQKIVRTADATPPAPAPSVSQDTPRQDRMRDRHYARNRWDRYYGYDDRDPRGWNGPSAYRDDPRDGRDDRYADRGYGPRGWGSRDAYGDRDGDWRDGPDDDGPYDDGDW